MKKTFALAASILIAATSGAFAKGTVISLDGFCDVLTIQKNKVLKTALTAVDDPDCEALFGAGFIGKVKQLGNSAVIGLHASGAQEEYVLRLDYPFVTGGSWVLYGTQDGVSLTAFAGSTYTVDGNATKGTRPVTAALRR